MTKAPLSPVVQGRFDELPAQPVLPHGVFQTEGREVSFARAGFQHTTAHVRVFGQGPPLFLVHRLMTSAYSWRCVFEPLGQHFTCYAPDLPGAGRTAPSHDRSYAPETLSGWLLALQEALGVRG